MPTYHDHISALATEIEKLKKDKERWHHIATCFYENRFRLDADELRWAAEAYERESDGC
jgi:predicted nucleotidyltransferase